MFLQHYSFSKEKKTCIFFENILNIIYIYLTLYIHSSKIWPWILFLFSFPEKGKYSVRYLYLTHEDLAGSDPVIKQLKVIIPYKVVNRRFIALYGIHSSDGSPNPLNMKWWPLSLKFHQPLFLFLKVPLDLRGNVKK